MTYEIKTKRWHKARDDSSIEMNSENWMLDETDGLREEIMMLVKQRNNLADALVDCLEKGKRWHSCDPVVIKAKQALRFDEE